MNVMLWDVVDARTDAPLAMDVRDHSEACRIREIFLRHGVPARVIREASEATTGRRESADAA